MHKKIFLGIRLKEPEASVDGLIRLKHEGKDYMGSYLDSLTPTLQNFRKEGEKILTSFLSFFPSSRLELHQLVIIPVVFIG